MSIRRIPDDGEPLSDVYNAELDRFIEKNKGTWLTVPWLYSEYVTSLFPRNKPALDDLTDYSSRCYLSVHIFAPCCEPYLTSKPDLVIV